MLLVDHLVKGAADLAGGLWVTEIAYGVHEELVPFAPLTIEYGRLVGTARRHRDQGALTLAASLISCPSRRVTANTGGYREFGQRCHDASKKGSLIRIHRVDQTSSPTERLVLGTRKVHPVASAAPCDAVTP